jgi:hypothetical protein
MTMKTYWVSVILFIGFLGVLPSGAVHAESDAKEAAAKDQAKKKKTTEVNFEDVLVQGKYHFSDEAVTTVEQDKVLDALLGVRTDFKDRLKKSSARH